MNLSIEQNNIFMEENRVEAVAHRCNNNQDFLSTIAVLQYPF